MNLDELMAVWKSQDSAPLHDVNKVLLHQALQQDEVRLQKAWRRDRAITYVTSAGVVASMAIFFGMMISFRQRPDKVVTGLDYALPIVGAAAALLAGVAMYVGHRAQARNEQRFGESLRDQLNRRIAQLDYAATRGHRTSVLIFVLMGMIWPFAILHLGMRVNDKSLSDASWVTIAMLILCFMSGARILRRAVPQAIARKQQLEALLKELDGQ